MQGRLPALAAGALLVLCLAACGPRRVSLPSGSGTPAPDAPAAYQEATAACRSANTVQATLSLSGRAGSMRLRGTVDAGFAAPDKVRLEGRYPFGRPAFVLAASSETAVLHLPRDERVLRGATTSEIMEALIGLPLSGAELRALVSGCGFGAAEPSGGRAYDGGWIAVDAGESVAYLRRLNGRWRLVAFSRPPFVVEYTIDASGLPGSARVQSSGATSADVRARISELELNVTFEADVFDLEVPAGVEPLTLDELRRAGPLGDR